MNIIESKVTSKDLITKNIRCQSSYDYNNFQKLREKEILRR